MNKQKVIYMDNNATTKVHKKVIKFMIPFMNQYYANPSSSHGFGKSCKYALEYARNGVANFIHVDSHEIVFCSGATEGNNNIIRGVFAANKHKGKHILVSKIEHASILKTCEDLKNREEAIITDIPVDKNGFVDYDVVKNLVRNDTILCIIMSENNEIGTFQKENTLKNIGKLCKENKIHFHCDATQTIGHRYFYPKDYSISSMTFSSHKFHGPKGIGCIFIDNHSNIISCCSTGGSQEWGKRAGTHNLPAIMGMYYALKMNLEKDRLLKTQNKLIMMRTFIIKTLKNHIKYIIINGPKDQQFCKFNTVSICLPNINSRKILPELDKFGIYVNIGSACSLGKRSLVLKACGIPEEQELGLLRISLSEYNNMEECEYLVKTLIYLYNKFKGKLL